VTGRDLSFAGEKIMLRKIIQIDEEKCIGCGQCANACAQGAIQMVNGKAKLVSETYCDGLGVCIGHCPVDAIKIIEKEVPVLLAGVTRKGEIRGKNERKTGVCKEVNEDFERVFNKADHFPRNSRLKNWPIQLMLLPKQAEFFNHADVVIAADCVAFAYADHFQELIKDKVLIIACPKLDNAQFYSEKLSEIFSLNKIKSITVLHMEVPCCHGLVHLVQQVLQNVENKEVGFKAIEIGLDGLLK